MYFGELRIIPTRVGTSFISHTTQSFRWDHPHACGDKYFSTSTFAINAGSSPRVWGQVLCKSEKLNTARIIPTRVGTSTVLFIF